MEKQIRYQLDETASNKNNIVENEYHHLEDRRFKCLTVLSGSFYVDDFLSIFKYEGGYKLKRNKDYVIADIDQKTSALLTGIIANVIIIINNKLGREFKVNYRAVGLHKTKVTERTVALLQAPAATEFSDSYIDLRNKPKDFTPSFHYHSLSEIKKFEILLFYIEKIRFCILYESISIIRFYIDTVETIINSLVDSSLTEYLSLREINFENFKTAYKTSLYNLDKVKNLSPLQSDTTFRIGVSQTTNEDKDGYLLLRALGSFRNAIYAKYLSKDETNIGHHTGKIIPSLFNNIVSLKIGSCVILDSITNMKMNNVHFDMLIYPNRLRENTQLIIKKVAGVVGGNYSIVVAIETATSIVYYGKISKTNKGFLVEWKELTRPKPIIDSIENLRAHLASYDNPHLDNKEHVDLGLVENLPLATKLDIITESKERKYFTWAQLDIYMKRYLLGKRPNKEEQLKTVDENIMRNFSVVFSNCGQDCKSTSDCKTFIAQTTLEPITPGPVFPTPGPYVTGGPIEFQ